MLKRRMRLLPSAVKPPAVHKKGMAAHNYNKKSKSVNVSNKRLS